MSKIPSAIPQKRLTLPILSDHNSQEGCANNKLFLVDILHLFYNFKLCSNDKKRTMLLDFMALAENP